MPAVTRGLILPLAALVVAAGGLGLILGLRSLPPSESEILERLAAAYAADTGRPLTDCYGVPSGVAGVRMIVICEAEGAEAWYAAVDELGRRLDALPAGPEPRT